MNLGVGVYTDDNGKIPLLECVRHAESERLKSSPPRGYLPIDGLAAYDQAVQELVFGAQNKNIVTVQALGGTGGLKIGADFLQAHQPRAPKSGSATRAGKTTASCSKAPASRSSPTATTTRRRAASTSPACRSR